MALGGYLISLKVISLNERVPKFRNEPPTQSGWKSNRSDRLPVGRKGTLSFKKDPASAKKNHTELQVVPEHSMRPSKQKKLLSA